MDNLLLPQGSERREFLMAQAEAGGGGALPASACSLLCRIEQIDQRLRHLEEERRPSTTRSYWSGDLQMQWMAAAATARPPNWEPSNDSSCRHQHSKSMTTSALQEVHLKGALMDRLHLLETRIQQLSFELDKGVNSGVAGTSTEIEYSQPSGGAKQQETGAICSGRIVGGPWTATPTEIFRIGARDIQSHRQKTKAKETKDLGKASAEKRAGSGTCSRNEKRRVERARLYRRWFPVGC